jgi:hypothetical protein
VALHTVCALLSAIIKQNVTPTWKDRLNPLKMKKDREIVTKAERRETKKRPRMRMSARGLRKQAKFSGMKLARVKR